MEPGVQEHHGDRSIDTTDQVRQHHAAAAEAHGEGHLTRERLDGPREHRVGGGAAQCPGVLAHLGDRKSTRLNSSHSQISYAVFCLKKKKVVDQHFKLQLLRPLTCVSIMSDID